MRRPEPLLCVVVFGVAVCTANESGPELWRRACARSKTLPGSAELDVEACVQGYARLPGYAAADLSRCSLRLEVRDEDGSTIRACVREETRDMFARGDRSDVIVTMHAEAIERHPRRPLSSELYLLPVLIEC